MKKSILAIAALLISTTSFASESPQAWLVKYQLNKSKVFKALQTDLQEQIKVKAANCGFDSIEASGSLKQGLPFTAVYSCTKAGAEADGGVTISATISGFLTGTDGHLGPQTTVSIDAGM